MLSCQDVVVLTATSFFCLIRARIPVPCSSASQPSGVGTTRFGYTDVLVVREIDCGNWLDREEKRPRTRCTTVRQVSNAHNEILSRIRTFSLGQASAEWALSLSQALSQLTVTKKNGSETKKSKKKRKNYTRMPRLEPHDAQVGRSAAVQEGFSAPATPTTPTTPTTKRHEQKDKPRTTRPWHICAMSGSCFVHLPRSFIDYFLKAVPGLVTIVNTGL